MKAKVKKEKAKVEIRDKENYKTNQINGNKRLALGNSQIKSLKDVLLNLLVDLSSNLILPLTYIPPIIANEQLICSILSANFLSFSKK